MPCLAERAADAENNPVMNLISDSEDGIEWDEQWFTEGQHNSLRTPTLTREPENFGRNLPTGFR